MNLLRSELRKISSTRLWWGLLIGVAVYCAIQAGATAATAGAGAAGQNAIPTPDTAGTLRLIYAGSAFSGAFIFALILGITGMTGEYRYQTITPTFLAEPRRSRVVAAKMLAHLAVGVGYGLVGLVVSVVTGAAVIAIRGYPLGLGASGLVGAMALAVLAVALWTLFGLGIGTMIRNQVAAILIGVVITLLLEPIASLVLHALHLDSVGQWLPSNASAAMTSPVTSFTHYLDWWAGGLVMLGYTALFVVAGIWLSVSRDIT
ncbi:MAG: ABC transporter permease subunit [Nocardioidaceae bacterium]